jgi:hypothetical protein
VTAIERGPLETVTADLVTWLESVAGQPVRVGPPVDGPEDTGVTLWPYELRAQRQTTGTGARHPYRLAVRYVVTAALPALDRVLGAAVRAGEPAVSLEGLDGAVWSAVRAVPRPVLVVEVPASVGHPAPDTPLVRGPLVLKQSGIRPLSGSVLGPGDEPVAAVRVEVTGTELATYTDAGGRFRLGGVPARDRIALRVEGRGRAFTADVDLTAEEAEEPVVIRCDFTGP